MSDRIEKLKVEVEQLKAESDRLWREFQEAEESVKPLRQAWYTTHEKRQSAEFKLAILQELTKEAEVGA